MKALLLIVLTVFSPSLLAENLNNFEYFGLSLLQHSYEDLDFAPGIDVEALEEYTLEVDDQDLGWRFFIGHHFNRFVAVEAGVSYFGKASFVLTQDIIEEGEVGEDGEAAESIQTTTVLFTGDSSTLAGDVRLVGTLPLGKHLFARAYVGSVFFNNERSYISEEDSEGVWSLEEEAHTGNSTIIGLGIAYGFNERFAMVLDYEEVEIQDVTTNAVSLSFMFSIGS